jgi:hypothetical protein
MPRPLKHPSVRQRRNTASSAATLYHLKPDEIEIPELPTRYDNDGNERLWSIHTQEWWEAIWSSPMAPEFHKSDIHGLYDMAVLKEAFWNGRVDLHSEIRLYEQQFGLNPLARRRLEWQIVDTEKAQEAAEERAEAKASKASRPTAVQSDDESDPLSA